MISSLLTSSVGSRAAISALPEIAEVARKSVSTTRGAFLAGSPPAPTAGSGSVQSYLTSFAPSSGSGNIIQGLSRFGLHTSPPGSIPVPPRPELDRVEISADQNVGVLDSFLCTVFVSLPAAESGRASRLLLFRATVGPVPGATKPSSTALGEMIPARNFRKNIDPISATAFLSSQLGIGTRVTDMIAADPQLGYRVVRSSGSNELPTPPPIQNSNRRAGSGDLIQISNVDQSVLNPLPRIRATGASSNQFFLTRRALVGQPGKDLPNDVGRRSGIHVLSGEGISPGVVVQGSNAADFQMIASVDLSSSRTVGKFVEVSVVDPAVVYGNRYSYYAVAEDLAGVRSVRSRMVQADIVVRIPPPSPELSFIVVGVLPSDPTPVPKFSLRSSASFSDHIEVFRRGGSPPDSSLSVNGPNLLVSSMAVTVGENGFYHVGDVLLGPDRSATFIDRTIVPGSSVDYRFYVVDCFGNKCQVPASCSISLPEVGGRAIPVKAPTITAEQIPGNNHVRVFVSSDDPRISAVRIGRTILSQNESGFHAPNQPESNFIGNGVSAKRAGSRAFPHLVAPLGWSGVVRLTSGTGEFLDGIIDFDRVYKYSATAVDRNGQESSTSFSDYVRVTTKPIIDRPHDVRVRTYPSDNPVAVVVEWSGSTADFSPAQLIGSQDDLRDSAMRSVYQVERRPVGGQWSTMPATTSSYFFDPISAGEAPPFRPPFVSLLGEYEYRVIAMQSGGFISTYSDPVRITVDPLPEPPTIFVRSTNVGVRPLAAIVSWNYGSGPVDRWDIERAAVNRIFGGRLTSADSSAVRSLGFVRLAEVPREASRARQTTISGSNDPSIYVGNRFFVDGAVDPANVYFYRVRAVLPSGRSSEWSYGGISLNDSAFQRKLASVLSDDEAARLSVDPRAITSTGIE